MSFIKIRNGLDLRVDGEPEQTIHAGPPIAHVALVLADYPGVQPALRVAAGDTVTRGQVLFEDERRPGVKFTAPAAGTIAALHRNDAGELISVVIALSDAERTGTPAAQEHPTFATYTGKSIPALSRDDVRALLLESGFWTAFRTRPFGRVPDAASVPDGIFITAMDTEPLAPKPEIAVQENAAAFDAGLAVIAKLREGFMYLCVAKDSPIKAGPYSGITVFQFAGRHPAGTVGAHIHKLKPAKRGKSVWHLGYQDVIRIGTLFTTGKLTVDAVAALGGPSVIKPRLVRTRMGAALDELLHGDINTNDVLILSGGPVSGRPSRDGENYLGRYDRCVAVRPRLGSRDWFVGGLNPFVMSLRAYLPSALGVRPAPLLAALKQGDAARAERLGVLGLDVEDVAFLALGQAHGDEYTTQLRRVLAQLDTQG